MNVQLEKRLVDYVTIRFAGDSGDGMQLTGDRFAREAARYGNLLLTLPDFPAEIRAPAGTVAGVSSFQITFGSQDVYTPGDQLDVLVAMNPAALKANMSDLKQNGVLICDADSFNERGLERAGLKENPLDDRNLSTKYTLVKAPITSLNSAALKDSGLDAASVRRCRNFFALGLVCWLFSRDPAETVGWIEKKFGKKPELATANKVALKAGMAFAESSEFFPAPYEIPAAELPPGRYRTLTGHQGSVLGLLAAAEKSGRQLYFAGYPITPASEVLQELTTLARQGVVTLQAEDEIAAVCASIGAAFAGSLAVTATSGPGMALKQEAVGLAVIAELPLVIINVQRAGPSTGMPTKTEQADLWQAIYGRHGESPLVVMAISRPADAFETVFEASRIALERMTPVVVLSDGYVANGSEPWRIPDPESLPAIRPPIRSSSDAQTFKPYLRDEQTLARCWAIPGTAGLEHRIGGLEKLDVTGAVSYDPLNHERMVQIRAKKVDGVASCFSPLSLTGPESGDLLVVGWGGTWGAIEAAVRKASAKGHSVSHLHLRHLNPLHADVEKTLRRFKRVLVPELNSGQLRSILRDRFLIDAKGLNKIQGRPFKVAEVLAGIEEMFRHE